MTKIVVIGGGISGFISAINAKNKNNEVTILEGQNSPLKKLLITGNGKCNYFNEDFAISHYYSSNNFNLENLITETNKQKILEFFQKIGIVPKIKNEYYYPHSNQAITVKNALLKEAEIKGIKIKLNSYVENITKQEDKFQIKTKEETITCDKLIISTGSKSYPKTGSDGSGYTLVEKLGHTINPVLPALTGLHGKENIFKDLSGVRCEGKVILFENDKILKEETGEIQFTNYGVSGICIFNLSGLASKNLKENKDITISINFVQDLKLTNQNELIDYLETLNNEAQKRTISELLDSLFNYKLTNVILKRSNIERDRLFEDLTTNEKDLLAENIMNFKITITDTNSFDNSQVCQGGVSLEEINQETFESKIVPNLYLTGEILDVYGDCGGYNIAFATLSGIIAGTKAGEEND